MIEDIVLDVFPKESGVYIFSSNDEVIYVGSSNNLYKRMSVHISSIRKGGTNNGISKQDLYKFLQSNPFTVEFQITDDYKQLEQELVERYHPRYNIYRAYTGVALNGNRAEYDKERYQKYKDQILEQKKQYNKSHKEQKKQYKKQYNESHKQQIKQYNNQLCYYNGETLTLQALSKRFQRAGLEHPIIEAKKYLIINIGK